jgi:hypothetical protein
MILWDLFFVLGVGFIITAIFTFGFRKVQWWGGVGLFFLFIILASWAGRLWIHGIGPSIIGIYWLPLVAIGFIFALVIAGALLNRTMREPDTIHIDETVESTESALNVFFWVLLVILVAMIILGYIYE